MKRSGFKPPSPKKLRQKQEEKRRRALGKVKAKKAAQGNSRRSRRVPKRNKDGSLAKSERIRRLKNKLWIVFSRYIRKSAADHTGWLTTVDGVWTIWQQCDCGHLFHNTERNALLGGNELWYYENNFAPQSNQGNRLGANDSAQHYMLAAVEKYGLQEVQKMRTMRQTYKLWTEEELVEKYEYYKSKLESI